MRVIAFFLMVSVLFSCGQEPAPVKPRGFEDSVITQFLARTDSLIYYDTSSMEYRLLRAYSHGDTGFFRDLKQQMNSELHYLYPSENKDCIIPYKLSALHVDEAYRFIHSQSFCNFSQAVTISRAADSIKLQYVEYLVPDVDGKAFIFTQKGKEYHVDSGCVVVKKFEKKLTAGDWKQLEEALYDTDFWGLQPTSPRVLLDGSSWRVDAYTKERRYSYQQQNHSVSRQSPALVAFTELGLLFMKLSGEKGMCEDFF